ncbi:MAG TPA: hypothetical protein EYN91_22330 [Candidatus Melainabacteria bacterium]|nr:hypothetical protein [Candidatus Melainabacteria bacterium]
MTTTKRQLSFYTDADTNLYLSLLDSGIKTKVINRALREFMQREAVIDLADGKRPANFWDLSEERKNELLKYLGSQAEGKADDHLWVIVQETTIQDFYQWAAKYLALHQLKFGKPYVLPNSNTEQGPAATTSFKLRKHFHERRESQSEVLQPKKKTTTVTLWLRVENNNKFVRGKKKAREDIEYMVLSGHHMKKLARDCAYELTFEYEDDDDLDKQIHEMLIECEHMADLRNCFTEPDVREKGTDRYW